jgi:dephospho-CoA kinase
MSIKLGLTGGIGSGKSTVADMFQRLGATVIDADAVSRRASATGGAAMPAIEREFGASFIAADGGLRRDTMRALVFSDATAKSRLEAIIHPIVGQEIRRLERLAVAAGCALLVFDIPLLVESAHWRPRLDLVLVVDCEPETQIQRVLHRDSLRTNQQTGWHRDQVLAAIAAQASRTQRLMAADIVICNEGLGLEALAKEVAQCAHDLGLSSGYDCA